MFKHLTKPARLFPSLSSPSLKIIDHRRCVVLVTLRAVVL
jgi:hypothetical protein